MKLIFSILAILCFLSSCQMEKSEVLPETKKEKSDKIHVLNFGTFHMGLTSDANSVDFDERNKENVSQVHKIAELIADFQPTVIIVETVPEYDSILQLQYENYLKNPDTVFKNPSEVELLAFELGRICGTKRIYGIDHKLGYNYNIGGEIENSIDSSWYNKYYRNPTAFYPSLNFSDTISLLEQLKETNKDEFLDFMISVNGDMLTHSGTKLGFEGADEAAKYYQRNLRMYSNLNRLKLNNDDRVFILMGASHTAFFRDFFSRSPKFEMVNTFDYLKLK